MPIRTTPIILHTKLIATITQINVIPTMMRIKIVVIAARNNLSKENSFASAVGFSLFYRYIFTSSHVGTKLFSYSASCHFGTKKCVSVGDELIVLRWSIIFTSAPAVHRLKMKPLHRWRRSCQLPIHRRGSSTYVPAAHKFRSAQRSAKRYCLSG